jgi:hypothetical protein
MARSPKSLNYGNTKVVLKDDLLDLKRKKAQQLAEYTAPPIEDEENRIPDKYKGDITFTRTIYSKGDFSRKVDTSFNELNTTNLPVEIGQFFDYYNEIFFDIPKEGENSHTTIIQTSLDYVESYNNPLQGVVDNLNTQIEELEGEIRRLENEIQNLVLGDSESLEESVNNQAAQAEYDAYVAQIGDTGNPTMTYNELTAKLKQLFNQGQLENDKENKYENGPKKDLRQAYEKAKASDLKYSNRTETQWRADVKKSSSGKDERDINLAIDKVRSAINSKLESLKPN